MTSAFLLPAPHVLFSIYLFDFLEAEMEADGGLCVSAQRDGVMRD